MKWKKLINSTRNVLYIDAVRKAGQGGQGRARFSCFWAARSFQSYGAVDQARSFGVRRARGVWERES